MKQLIRTQSREGNNTVGNSCLASLQRREMLLNKHNRGGNSCPASLTEEKTAA
jgi:hypothetical protein